MNTDVVNGSRAKPFCCLAAVDRTRIRTIGTIAAAHMPLVFLALVPTVGCLSGKRRVERNKHPDLSAL